MTLAEGARLGAYEITGLVGAGGMGEVYRARDTRLDRTVAIKVLRDGLSRSPERLERFEREARAIAQLSHPHICSLYDVGREDGTDFLVMEFLEGETLSARLAKGPVPVEQVLRHGIQIAEALDQAHRQGIVHRDLKPGNVMLTRTGIKLLDFGLARTVVPVELADPLSALPTSPEPLTAHGAILGTLQYMAPEQLDGRQADARTDIFALGSILHEMATGRRTFPGTSQASLIGEILHVDPPPISTLRPLSPPALDRLVKTCLAKDPEERWQSAGDLARELKWIAEGPPRGAPAPAAASGRRASRERLAWTLAAAGFAIGLLSASLSLRTRMPEEPTRFLILPPSGQTFFGPIVLSPDSRRILFLLRDEAGRNSLAVRPLESLEMRPLAGTEEARGAFWSPDGREIAFFSDGKLKRIGADGGPARTVCDSGAAFSGAWSREDVILFAREFGAPISAVSATGGTPRPVTALDAARGDIAHAHPAFLPDARHFVFVARNVDPEKTSVVLASLDSKEVRRLFAANSSAVFADPGFLLFARDDAVLAWRFDPRRLQLVGEPVPAFENVHCQSADDYLALSAAGSRVAYLSWSLKRRLVWVDRRGRELGTLGETGGYVDVRVSPDGRKVAVARRDPSRGRNLDVWVLDADRGTETRVTAARADEFNPAWYPDGERLVYISERFGFYDLFGRPATGGAEETLVRSKQDKGLPTFLPDGRHLLVSVPESGTYTRVVLSLSDPGDSRHLSSGSRFSEEHPSLSPDGLWTAFDSQESGQREVYVQPLADGPMRQVSIGGGQMPVWNRNGRELFYAARDGTLMSVPIRLDPGHVEPAEPQLLFPLRLDVSGELPFHLHPYDVSPDGQRFLVIRRAPGAEPDGAVVVTDWTAALKGTK